MKNLIKLPLLLTAISSASYALADDLRIIHFNDIHARYEPVNKYNTTCSKEELTEEGKCFGGVARLKTAIEQYKKEAMDKNYDVLVLSAGDAFQGSIMFSHYRGKVTSDVMNSLGLDAWTLGNHEFDLGEEAATSFAKNANFPVLLKNVEFSEDATLDDYISGYTIKEINGKKVGIFGLLAEDTKETASPGKNIDFSSVIDATNAQIAEFKDMGVDHIIALSHIGIEADKRIAAQSEGIDIIVGGHSHTLLANDNDKAQYPYPLLVKNKAGKEVPIVQSYAYSQYLGVIDLSFDDNGDVTSWNGNSIRLDNNFAEDEELLAKINDFAEPLHKITEQVVALSANDIEGSREFCRTQECQMGNLVADAMLAHVKNQGVQIAIQNGGGLRASIKSGDVTMGDVLTVLPFQNTLSTFEIEGKYVREMLEQGLSQIEDVAGRFPQVAGLRYSFNVKNPAGSRITSLQWQNGDEWQDLDDNEVYKVTTNDYVRQGGDGYSKFAEEAKNAYDFGPNLENVVIEYLQDYMQDNPKGYVPYLDGRITAE